MNTWKQVAAAANTQNEISIPMHEPQRAGRAARIIKGRTIRYLSGCDSFLIAFSFYLRYLFWRRTSDKHVLCFFQKIEISNFVLWLPYSVLHYLLVYSGQHIFHQFIQQTVFSAHIFNIFFLTFVVTNFIILLDPPPPRYLMVRPINVFYNQ